MEPTATFFSGFSLNDMWFLGEGTSVRLKIE